MNAVALETRQLSKVFENATRQQVVLRDLDIKIYEGDFTVIMGASGAGKSTLLYALSGMDRPTSGSIGFFNAEITGLSNDQLAVFRRQNCGFIFQQMFLLDSMSILDNIVMCGLLVCSDKKKIARTAQDLLLKVGLDETIWSKFPSQLSGGENQRAAIVRALINEPKIIFADEPTGSLNSAAGVSVLDVLTDVNANGQSIIMVTHDINSALRGNQIIFIRDGQVSGRCTLDRYRDEDAQRRAQLTTFLASMGW
ncbi:MAG: ABC transporter ATP-binding protein [Coriobacteriia bacterium]|nr:ABC transporter ATP-binding protein [Coriobacteriia bacterium]